MIVNREAAIAKAIAERRRHERVQVELNGRLFLPGDGREAPCQIIEMSAEGAQVICETVPEAGASAILYIEGFGRFETEVVRSEWGRFAVALRCSPLKQTRVAELLQQITHGGDVSQPLLRRHERIEGEGIAHFTRSSGQIVACEVLDLSLSGVSLRTEIKPTIGEIVMIGQMSGRVVRHHESGIGVEFTNAPSVLVKRSRAAL
ncbi:MAG TPA: PilZ domain-containing protein [Rhizomicrobium sp.]|jgi:hypothetical protein|nr:PilZ domain-containing protein [Rhizomicrobium sp.]